MSSPTHPPLVPLPTQRRWVFSAATKTPSFARYLPAEVSLSETRFEHFLTLTDNEIVKLVTAQGWPAATARTVNELPALQDMPKLPRFLIFDPALAHCHRLYLNANDIAPLMRTHVFATGQALFAYIARDLIFSLQSRWMTEWRKSAAPSSGLKTGLVLKGRHEIL